MNQLLVVHGLPLWFLVFSLFLPRVSLALAWLQGVLTPFRMLHGLVPLVIAVVLPRLLILWMIYVDQGLSLWFLIHLLAAVLVWGGSGGYGVRRRGRRGSDY